MRVPYTREYVGLIWAISQAQATGFCNQLQTSNDYCEVVSPETFKGFTRLAAKEAAEHRAKREARKKKRAAKRAKKAKKSSETADALTTAMAQVSINDVEDSDSSQK